MTIEQDATTELLKLAESLHRRKISAAIKAALAEKKRRGEPVGRRRSLPPSRLEAARSLLAEGKGPVHVARLLKVDRSTLYRALRRQREIT